MRKSLLVLLLLAEPRVGVTVSLLRLLLGSGSSTGRGGSLVILGERALEKSTTGGVDV
jgi:hypothetical protein